MSEDPHVNDLYEDMERLNALYEELMWAHDVELEFSADYENNRIIISLKDESLKRPALQKMTIKEKIAAAESRIKELKLLIEHWKKQNDSVKSS